MSVDYHQYIQSEEWRRKARAVKEWWGNRCALCGSKNSTLHAHHNTYDRLGEEQFTDLIPLCPDCHARHHNVLPEAPKKKKRIKISPPPIFEGNTATVPVTKPPKKRPLVYLIKSAADDSYMLWKQQWPMFVDLVATKDRHLPALLSAGRPVFENKMLAIQFEYPILLDKFSRWPEVYEKMTWALDELSIVKPGPMCDG